MNVFEVFSAVVPERFFLPAVALPEMLASQATLEKCRRYAGTQNSETADYISKRDSQFDYRKKERDIFYGKIAEAGTCGALRKLGISCEEPDYSIHTRRSFGSPDLVISGVSYGVKCTDITSYFGDSFVFQKADLAANPYRLVFLCDVCPLARFTVQVVGLARGDFLKEHAGKMKKSVFNDTKVAIYKARLNEIVDTVSRS